ncbi:hypothetical protein DNTS_007806 [Danionella cerebrum]|uniref:CST complex subunit CTC1 n=1 Tax=Danionella cerebrum TaxID=2873325 RepID=A0A553N5R1_9TELE|nr:hypothetical protein DNTS_007806 [Danionella translucida]
MILHLCVQERLWLSQFYQRILQLASLAECSGFCPIECARSTLQKIQMVFRDLPLSYKFVSVSEMKRDQRISCCSSSGPLKMHPAIQKTLPHDNLMLIGFLCDGRTEGASEGVWRVRDEGGSIPCMMLQASNILLGQLMFFPSWNYITHDAPGEIGFLELREAPVSLSMVFMVFEPGGSLSENFSVSRMVELLRDRSYPGRAAVCVEGEVSAVCPPLLISGCRFFFLELTDGQSSLIELKDQVWSQCLRVGQTVAFYCFRVCSLQSLKGRRVLTDCSLSRLDILREAETPSSEEETTPLHSGTPDTHIRDAPPGTITKILNLEAGLFELEGQVGLCMAYQPVQKWHGALRPGAKLLLHNVHFTYDVSSLAPRVLLFACLRSSVQLTAFSLLSPEEPLSKRLTQSALQDLLLKHNLPPAHFIWLSYCHSAVLERLCPRWVCAERAPVVAKRLLDAACDANQSIPRERDIYREMVHLPHYCPITMLMKSIVWSPDSLSSLLSVTSRHQHLTAAELNAELRWSVCVKTLDELAQCPSSSDSHSVMMKMRKLMVVGVLQLDAQSASLQLTDRTHSLQCLCVKSDGSPFINSAWQGCLVCVRNCSLVMERFMETSFPSWKHLDQSSYITHKHCRLYLKLCMDDLLIISPSAAMRHLQTPSLSQPAKPPRSGGVVSVVFQLLMKQGVDLHFVGVCVRWFPVLHPGCLYRLIIVNTQDVNLLKPMHPPGATAICNLVVQPQWRIHTLAEEAQVETPALMSVCEVVHSNPDIVSFHGVISERITLQDDHRKNPNIRSVIGRTDGVKDLRVQLVIQDAVRRSQSVSVYLDLEPHTLGLIPGASVEVHHVQRKISGALNVYCSTLSISYLNVVTLSTPAFQETLPPRMLLDEWTGAKQCTLGQFRGFVDCVMSLTLQWTCSLCYSIYKQSRCSQTYPQCDSTSAVFQAEAKVVVEDGSSKAFVWFSSERVRDLLQLDEGQWAGVQRRVRIKGILRLYRRGHGLTCDGDPEDVLVQYLSFLCMSATVRRQIHLSCQLRSQKKGKSEAKVVRRGRNEFLSRFPSVLVLHCQQILDDSNRR